MLIADLTVFSNLDDAISVNNVRLSRLTIIILHQRSGELIELFCPSAEHFHPEFCS